MRTRENNSRSRWIAAAWDKGGMLILFLVLFLYAAFGVPNFLTHTNLIYALGLSVTTTGIVACGMLFCLAAGAFDLSVGSVAAFAGIFVAIALQKMGGSLLAIPVCLAACACIGLFNGFFIAV